MLRRRAHEEDVGEDGGEAEPAQQHEEGLRAQPCTSTIRLVYGKLLFCTASRTGKAGTAHIHTYSIHATHTQHTPYHTHAAHETGRLARQLRHGLDAAAELVHHCVRRQHARDEEERVHPERRTVPENLNENLNGGLNLFTVYWIRDVFCPQHHGC